MHEDSDGQSNVMGLDLGDPEVLRLVRRIFWRRFAPRCERLGLDPEDVHGEILLALVKKQLSPRSRFDSTRAGASKYIYMVCGSILSHMAEARRCRPTLVLDDEGDDSDAYLSAMERAVAPDSLSMIDVQVIQEAVDEATDRTIPVPVLVRILGGEDARRAARAEGLDGFAASEIAEAWRSYTAPAERHQARDVLGMFG